MPYTANKTMRTIIILIASVLIFILVSQVIQLSLVASFLLAVLSLSYGLYLNFKGENKEKSLIFIFSLTSSLLISIYAMYVYDPDETIYPSVHDLSCQLDYWAASPSSVISPIWQGIPNKWKQACKKDYQFFSGSPGGFYIRIGEQIEAHISDMYIPNSHDSKSQTCAPDNPSNSTDCDTTSLVTTKNRQTAGGYDNAINVLVTPKSFGLVQEETLGYNDPMREKLKYIAPLYMERMHILYNTKNSDATTPIRISSVLREPSKEFFAEARISTGPVGSSGRIMASYILSHINQQLKSQNTKLEINAETYSYTTKEGLQKLIDGEIDIVFSMAGAPLGGVSKVLEEHKHIKLMSIEPSAVSDINQFHKVNFRATDFKNKYFDIDGDSIKASTLGAYAYLIASPDIKNSEALTMLNAIKNSRDNIKANIEFDLHREKCESGINQIYPQQAKELCEKTFQLNEFSAIDSFENENENSLTDIITAFIPPISSIIILLPLFFSTFTWWSSLRKQSNYMHEINTVIANANSTPPQDTDNDHSIQEPDSNNTNGIPQQNPNNSQEQVLARATRNHPAPNSTHKHIVKVLKSIDEMSITISKDFQTGGMTETHYNFLNNQLLYIKDNWGQGLFICLKLKHSTQLSQEILDEYVSLGYLNYRQYQKLLIIKRQHEQTPPTDDTPNENVLSENAPTPAM